MGTGTLVSLALGFTGGCLAVWGAVSMPCSWEHSTELPSGQEPSELLGNPRAVDAFPSPPGCNRVVFVDPGLLMLVV